MKNKNLETYYEYCEVPKEAQKQILGGRLRGMTDINPQWRIKVLTELFGRCGEGWYYDVNSIDFKDGADQTVICIVTIKFYYKTNGNKDWSAPIFGSGGSSFISKEKNGLYTNDECTKMAITDALGVVCKQLGIGASIYWNKDNTKYVDIKRDNSENYSKAKITKPPAYQIDKFVTTYSNICDLRKESILLFNKNIYDIDSIELNTLIKKIKSK